MRVVKGGDRKTTHIITYANIEHWGDALGLGDRVRPTAAVSILFSPLHSSRVTISTLRLGPFT